MSKAVVFLPAMASCRIAPSSISVPALPISAPKRASQPPRPGYGMLVGIPFTAALDLWKMHLAAAYGIDAFRILPDEPEASHDRVVIGDCDAVRAALPGYAGDAGDSRGDIR